MSRRESTSTAWAVGGTVFAGTMMLIMGIYQILMGIAAIAEDGFFVVAQDYVYDVNTTTWGWVHLIIGVVAVLAGFFVFTGAMWARAVGIALAVLSAIANFFFIPYYPLWALLIIALDVFVIWSLATVGRRQMAMDTGYEAGAGAGVGTGGTGSGQRWATTNPSGYANEGTAAQDASGRTVRDAAAEAEQRRR